MSRRGRPYFDNLGGRSRGSSSHYQPSRDGFNHHRQHQQSSNYWQDNYRSGNDNSYSSSSPWIPPNQGFNNAWSNQNQPYWNNIQTSFQAQHRSPAPPLSSTHNVRPKKCFSTSFQGSWGLPPPPPSRLPLPPLVAPINLPIVAVNPPPGSKEAREKRLEESRERLVKSLKESKSETTCKDILNTSNPPSTDEGQSRPESNANDDSLIRSNQGSNLISSSQQRRSSLECISLAYSETNKPSKPTPVNKRVRSTSFSSSSSKKPDSQSPQRSKGQVDAQIQDIKQQVIQQILSLSQNKIQEIVSNPRSRKFEFVMKYMMKESRCEQSQKQRQIAQAGILGTPLDSTPDLVPLDYERLLSDPDLAVNLSNLPAEMIETLGNIFNLKSEKRDVEMVDLDKSDDAMNVEDVPNSSNIQESLPETEDIHPVVLNQSDSVEVMIANKTNANEHESDTVFATESDPIANVSMNDEPSINRRGSSPTLDFSLADHLEDVNAEINRSSSANSFSDSEDISSVFTALEHSAENLADSMEQVQFHSLPIEEKSTILEKSTKEDLISKEYEGMESEFDVLPLPVHQELSSDPTSAFMEETPISYEADPIELLDEFNPTEDPLALPAVFDISSNQTLPKDDNTNSTVPDPEPVIESRLPEFIDAPKTLDNNVTTPEKMEISRQTSELESQDMTDVLTVASSCLPLSTDPNIVNANPITEDAIDSNPSDNQPINNNDLINNEKLINVNLNVETNDIIDIEPSDKNHMQSNDENSGPSKDSDKLLEIPVCADHSQDESESALSSKPMVKIEQSLLDQVNLSIYENFEDHSQTPQSDYDVDEASSHSHSGQVLPLEGIVKLEVEDPCETALAAKSAKHQTPAVEVSTQTEIPSNAIVDSPSSDLQSTLNHIENLCQDHGLQPAFQQLKLLLNAGDIPSDVIPSKRGRQTNQSGHKISAVSSSRRPAASTQAASISLPIVDAIDSLQTMLGEIAKVAVPQERLKLIFKKITEIEKRIESWTEMKKKLYEQVNGILRDEQSASSSQEDNEDAERTRTKKLLPAMRGLSVSLDSMKVYSISSQSLSKSPAMLESSKLSQSVVNDTSIDDCQVLPVKSSKKKAKRKSGISRSKRKKVPTPTKSKTSLVANISPRSIPQRTCTLVERTKAATPEVVSSPRNQTPSRPSPASSLRSRRVETIIDSPPVISPLRKTKAELKQMVTDPIESDLLPSPRRTRTSVVIPDVRPSEEVCVTGRRSSRKYSVTEVSEDKATPSPEKKRTRQTAGEELTRAETSTRSKRSLDKVDSECQVVYTKMMRSCSVVLQPLEQPAKKPRLSVKKDLFQPNKPTSVKKEKLCDPLKLDDDSSSDDDVPLFELSKSRNIPSTEDTAEVPPLSTIDVWLVREDVDQNSISSCDTGATSAEQRTEDGDSTPATNFHSRPRKKKSKKSKSKGEDGEQSEHQSSKLDHLIFADHPRGAVLDIKVVNRQVLAASEEGVIFSYSIKSGKLKKSYTGHSAAITCFCIIDDEEDHDQHRLITGSLDEYSRSYMIKSAEQSHPPLKVGAAVSIDQKWGYIFIGTKLGEVIRIDTKMFTVLDEPMKFSQEAILALKATKEGPRRVLIVGTRNQAITVRDAETGLLLRSVSGFGQLTVYSLLLHKALVYCGTMQGNIPVYDFTNGQEMSKFIAGNGVRCLKIYYGLLFAGCYDGFIYVFNVHDQRLITKIPGSGKMILCMDISKNKIIFSCKDSFQALNFPADVCQALKDAKSK